MTPYTGANGYAPAVVTYIIGHSADDGGFILKTTASALPYGARPTRLSQLDNDTGYATADEVSGAVAAAAGREVSKVYEDTIGYGTGYSTGTAEVELAADKFHIVGRCAGLTLTLPDGSEDDGREYVCQFYVGLKDMTLTLPDTVAWLNGEAPTLASNSCYMLSIVNHCAVIGAFKQSS